MKESISGYFISCDPQESKLIEETLSEEGYEISPKGLKQWVLDNMADEPDPKARQHEADATMAQQFAAFLRDNPDTVTLYANLGAAALQGTFNRFVAGVMKKARG